MGASSVSGAEMCDELFDVLAGQCMANGNVVVVNRIRRGTYSRATIVYF